MMSSTELPGTNKSCRRIPLYKSRGKFGGPLTCHRLQSGLKLRLNAGALVSGGVPLRQGLRQRACCLFKRGLGGLHH